MKAWGPERTEGFWKNHEMGRAVFYITYGVGH